MEPPTADEVAKMKTRAIDILSEGDPNKDKVLEDVPEQFRAEIVKTKRGKIHLATKDGKEMSDPNKRTRR